ncbi:hypothetical protein K438DRAFT_1773351 [Mycena galopus ATCC 62051]|nr:hypothetical protein K438DRAFT_1773351 [Mycena galopus ATCC 62051]
MLCEEFLWDGDLCGMRGECICRRESVWIQRSRTRSRVAGIKRKENHQVQGRKGEREKGVSMMRERDSDEGRASTACLRLRGGLSDNGRSGTTIVMHGLTTQGGPGLPLRPPPSSCTFGGSPSGIADDAAKRRTAEPSIDSEEASDEPNGDARSYSRGAGAARGLGVLEFGFCGRFVVGIAILGLVAVHLCLVGGVASASSLAPITSTSSKTSGSTSESSKSGGSQRMRGRGIADSGSSPGFASIRDRCKGVTDDLSDSKWRWSSRVRDSSRFYHWSYFHLPFYTCVEKTEVKKSVQPPLSTHSNLAYAFIATS